MISEHEHNEAAACGEERMQSQPRATKAFFDQSRNLVVVEFNRGYSIMFPPQRSQALAAATADQLSQIEIDFPGFSIYFPLLDEGLKVSKSPRC